MIASRIYKNILGCKPVSIRYNYSRRCGFLTKRKVHKNFFANFFWKGNKGFITNIYERNREAFSKDLLNAFLAYLKEAVV